ncbi:GNAT family N-acetyltransferase [Microbacterium thalli]|uniref:GNAT family N-acetyltransferase n=1 Tax=Microbacterium thalli TaxID=3027921 RepID=A0ABT5SL43_9MICO|nr:GNAT family N-acetyltransferase [Microbacterium thalli]MDD7963554.1 GNAT family N-acetyltransferase [Microbacterium thalli]MDN8549574.1 N-acetyltransferase family protein [Microbacterium thalli]
MTATDWPEVEAIYREGITAGNATFETEPPPWNDFDQGKLTVGRLVATDPAGSVLGWVAASRVSGREVYRGVVEHSVYVADRARGCGVGTALLTAFLGNVDAADIWTVQASIFPENTASLALHERAGFRRIGHRERIAHMTYGPWAGTWRDTILIERRHS